MTRAKEAAAEGEPGAIETEADRATANASFAADDRLAAIEPPRPLRRLGAIMPLAALSAAVHLLVVAAFLLWETPAPAAHPEETAVEVVQEPAPEKKREEAKPDAEQAQPEQPTPEQHVDERKPDASEAKPDAQQRATAEPPPRPEPVPSAEDVANLEALQNELAALKAQQADLQAQGEAQARAEAQAAAQAAQAAKAAAADRTKALGLLPESFSAATMPALSPTGEDPITYQQAVYNLVNRAKRSGQTYMAGVAHVVFDIDDKGALTRVVVDHSSGNAAVDQEAVALIHRAAPFPPPPAGAPRSFPAYMSFVADH